VQCEAGRAGAAVNASRQAEPKNQKPAAGSKVNRVNQNLKPGGRQVQNQWQVANAGSSKRGSNRQAGRQRQAGIQGAIRQAQNRKAAGRQANQVKRRTVVTR